MRRRGSIVIALSGICLTSAAQVQDDDAPDLDFLEYLGSWQAEDDEWLVIAEWEKDNPGKDGQDADGDTEGEKPDPKGNEDDKGK
jgi:hypothetical protein